MDIREEPYAQWLEKTLRGIVEMKPERICLCAMLPGGEVATCYYQCDAGDLALFAHNIYSDAMLEVIRNNRDLLQDDDEEAEDE